MGKKGRGEKAYFEDDKVVDLDLTVSHVLADGTQVLVDVLYNYLCGLSGQNLLQDISIIQPISSTFRSCLKKNTYWETFFDSAQYSLLFISNPLISVDVLFSFSTLIAAYFFF